MGQKPISTKIEPAFNSCEETTEKPFSGNKGAPNAKILTPRELEVISHTAYGANRSEIAKLLQISEETVKVYVERICRKLNAVNKTHATVIAISLGLIEACKSSDSEMNADKDFVPHTGNPQTPEISVLPTYATKKRRV